nr:hypothetical protein [Sulfitobacter pontiacus]
MDIELVMFLVFVPAHHHRVDQRVKFVSRCTGNYLIRQRACEISHVGPVKGWQVFRQVDGSRDKRFPLRPQCLQLRVHRIQPFDQCLRKGAALAGAHQIGVGLLRLPDPVIVSAQGLTGLVLLGSDLFYKLLPKIPVGGVLHQTCPQTAQDAFGSVGLGQAGHAGADSLALLFMVGTVIASARAFACDSKVAAALAAAQQS